MYLKDLYQHEIEKMIDDGRLIFWKNSSYPVIKDRLGQYLIAHKDSVVGLKSVFSVNETSNDFYEVTE